MKLHGWETVLLNQVQSYVQGSCDCELYKSTSFMKNDGLHTPSVMTVGMWDALWFGKAKSKQRIYANVCFIACLLIR